MHCCFLCECVLCSNWFFSNRIDGGTQIRSIRRCTGKGNETQRYRTRLYQSENVMVKKYSPKHCMCYDITVRFTNKYIQLYQMQSNFKATNERKQLIAHAIRANGKESKLRHRMHCVCISLLLMACALCTTRKWPHFTDFCCMLFALSIASLHIQPHISERWSARLGHVSRFRFFAPILPYNSRSAAHRAAYARHGY